MDPPFLGSEDEIVPVPVDDVEVAPRRAPAWAADVEVAPRRAPAWAADVEVAPRRAPAWAPDVEVAPRRAPAWAADVEAAPPRAPARAADVVAAAAPHRAPARAADDGGVDYLDRAPWLRAAVLGAHYGLVSIASIMLGLSSVKTGDKTLLALGLAGLFGGACTMAIGEYISVYCQLEIQLYQISKQRERDGPAKERLPSPTRAALASALAFALGAAVPLLAALFVKPLVARIFSVCGATTAGLAGLGATAAYLGGAPMSPSGFRAVAGGWLAMAAGYALLFTFAKIFARDVTKLA